MYPKVKNTKVRIKIKMSIIKILYDVKNIILDGVRAIKSRENFVVFVKKSFHF